MESLCRCFCLCMFLSTPTRSFKENDKFDYYSSEVKRLVDLGVDWIETDDPEQVYALIYGS